MKCFRTDVPNLGVGTLEKVARKKRKESQDEDGNESKTCSVKQNSIFFSDFSMIFAIFNCKILHGFTFFCLEILFRFNSLKRENYLVKSGL